MLWIVDDNASYQIISCNTHDEGEISQLWITRPNGKSLKIREGSKEEVRLFKEAIDWAIEHKETVLRLV